MGDTKKEEAPTAEKGGDKMNSIDKAIRAVQAKAAAKKQNAGTDGSAANEATAKAPKEKKPKLTDEEKAAKKQADDEAKAARKAERAKQREENRAKKAAEKKAPHMSKVNKAAEKLPKLSDTAQTAFNNITTSLSRNDITSLSAHLQHFNRIQATERALGQKLEVGQRVKIVGGDQQRFIGSFATVTVVQRIRCYVAVDGAKPGAKDVYLFTSDVEPAAAAEPARKAS